MKISTTEALAKLAETDKEFTKLFSYQSLKVEIYKPVGEDKQQPHDQDEIYVIANGTATFFHEGETTDIKAGDFLFVKAGDEHRFLDFSEDFSTWVFFYGAIGGEAENAKKYKE